jgi:hypothetical protein
MLLQGRAVGLLCESIIFLCYLSIVVMIIDL